MACHLVQPVLHGRNSRKRRDSTSIPSTAAIKSKHDHEKPGFARASAGAQGTACQTMPIIEQQPVRAVTPESLIAYFMAAT